jgi:hypothetical protein
MVITFALFSFANCSHYVILRIKNYLTLRFTLCNSATYIFAINYLFKFRAVKQASLSAHRNISSLYHYISDVYDILLNYLFKVYQVHALVNLQM